MFQILDYLPEQVPPWLERSGAALLLTVLVTIAYCLAVRGISLLRARKIVSEGIGLLLVRLLRYTALIAGAVLVLQCFGLLQNVWTLLCTVLALVALGFVAVWSILSNLLCSVILMIAGPFQVGDRIKLPSHDLEGKVVNFNLLYTTLRGQDDTLIQIPNNIFFQVPICRRPAKSGIGLEEQLRQREDADQAD
jgi:small-conductance mechanosensitive channel